MKKRKWRSRSNKVNFIGKACKRKLPSQRGFRGAAVCFAEVASYLHVVLGVQAVDEARQAAQEAIRCCSLRQGENKASTYFCVAHCQRYTQSVVCVCVCTLQAKGWLVNRHPPPPRPKGIFTQTFWSSKIFRTRSMASSTSLAAGRT